jgi:hypothetical protein
MLIASAFADRVNSGLQLTPNPEIKWLGNTAIIDLGDGPVVIEDPVIAGAAPVGSVLTCTQGNYYGSPAPTVTRTWNRNGTPIPGEVGLTYTTQVEDQGAAITVEETVTNAGGSVEATSNSITVT